jgi:hypothetical protein
LVLTFSFFVGEEISWRFGLVTPPEQPQISFLYAPFDEMSDLSRIDSRLKFETAAADLPKNKRVHIAIFHSAEGFRIGVDHLGKKSTCCNRELVSKGKCTLEGEILMDEEMTGPSSSFHVFSRTLNQSVVWINETFTVERTGVYYYFLANCGKVDTTVDGYVRFLNPFGFLGVTEFPSLVFYSLSTWIYVFAVMVWFMLCVVHFKDIFFLQIFIGVLFLVGFAEMAIWYGEYTFTNVTGHSSMFLVVTAVLTSTIKKTLSRTLVLVTSLGLGIMVTKLEKSERVRIIILTVLYSLCSGAFDLLRVFERHSASGQKLSFIFLMLLAILDVIFYYWTLLSLSVLLKQLSTRRNKMALAKMVLYKQLWWILILTGLFSAGLIIGQVALVASLKSDDTWMVLWWLRFAVWDIGYFLILLSVAYLFRPMDNNQRFAISEDNEMDMLNDASEISSLPLGVDLILEDAGEDVEGTMKQA